MPLNAQITLSIIAHESAVGDISRQIRVTPVTYALMLADGVGAGQAQVVWSDSRTVGTSPETLTMTALSDTRDGAAVTVAFSSVKVVYVRNTSTTASLKIGGGVGVGVFSGTPTIVPMPIPPGGCYFLSLPDADGFAAGTSKFESSSGNCTYDIVLIGEGTVS